MDIEEVVKSQYRAALAMLGDAIEKCPDALWAESETEQQFWHIAYHALFFTHLYLQTNEEAFVPWEKHRENHQYFEGEPYTQAELLDYLMLCQKEVEEKVKDLDWEAESGFDWLPMNKLGVQFYNIRHIQHHVGQLEDRLRIGAGIGVRWIAIESAGDR